ncbi:MAG: efflux RND transporter periplasmic adaptor subunit [Candidatus Aminicenantes bacterium]|nr:efflux RND transporter periplasmic adaptor subunit [Candidatus Aminicenantes bacterium]
MKKKAVVGAVILVVLVGAILGYTLIKKGKTAQVKYRTEVLAKGDLESMVTTSGSLNPVDTVDVGSQVSGKITILGADFNSKVKKGQILAQLDLELLNAKVDQAESSYKSRVASLDQAKLALDNSLKKFNRSKELFAKSQISIEEMETAESNYLNAKANVVSSESALSQAKSSLNSSKVDLSYAIIRSPIDGVVISRNVNIGQTVAASYQAPLLFKLASDLTKMQLQCDIDETDIGKVKEGQKVRFNVSAYQGETFIGTVRQVRYSPQTVQNVVTYATIVDAENPDLKLMPGMTATVQIITGEAKGVLKIPNAAMRFTPPLPLDEVQKILADAGIGGGQRGQGQPGQKTEAGQAQTGQRSGGMQTGTGQELTAEQRARFEQMRNRPRQGGNVWVLDDQGKLKPYLVRTGITDNTYSEIVRSELKEGMKIIIGLETPVATTQQGFGQSNPQQMMRFVGGGR